MPENVLNPELEEPQPGHEFFYSSKKGRAWPNYFKAVSALCKMFQVVLRFRGAGLSLLLKWRDSWFKRFCLLLQRLIPALSLRSWSRYLASFQYLQFCARKTVD